MLQKKRDVFWKFREWKTMADKLTGQKLKTLRSDNGSEYISKEFQNYLREEAVGMRVTVSKTLEQNGMQRQ